MSKEIRVRLACDTYEHTRPLFDGRVSPSGIELVCEHLGPAAAFERLP
jgi:hypothetical protein